MNILVIGGTRLLGLALVKKLINFGHNITIISRNKNNAPENVNLITKDRSKAIKDLIGMHFDIIIDFIAYDDNSVKEVFENIKTDRYILISSVWMKKLNPLISVDQKIDSIDDDALDKLPEITQNYLLGKMKAENYLYELNKQSNNISVIRLPIFWDKNEHTQRLNFYIERISEGSNPVISVNGGKNIAQVAWVDDLARAMCEWINIAKEESMWEALPCNGVGVRNLISFIAEVLEKDVKFVEISSDELKNTLPQYLENEPLWREEKMLLTKNNIFTRLNLTPTPIKEWIAKIVTRETFPVSKLRAEEIKLIERLSNVK